MKLTFYLMTFKGYYVLNQYLKRFDANTIEVVFVSRDNSIQNDYYDQIIELCQKFGVRYLDRNIKYSITSAYAITIGWRWIINTSSKLIVLHDSLLPRYRGFAPLVNSLINGEKEIGVTALYASKSYDTGEIIAQKSREIKYPIKIKDAIESISPLYYELVEEIAVKVIEGETITSKKQNEDDATYSLWRDNDDYLIDWSLSSQEIKRFVDAVGYPYNGARTTLNDKNVIIYDVELEKDVVIENRQVGKVIFIIEGFPVVVCGSGLLKITNIKYECNNLDALPLDKFRSRSR